MGVGILDKFEIKVEYGVAIADNGAVSGWKQIIAERARREDALARELVDKSAAMSRSLSKMIYGDGTAESSPASNSCAATDKFWSNKTKPVVRSYHTPVDKDDMEKWLGANVDWYDEDTRASDGSNSPCKHEYINVGFSSRTMVCKHCDEDEA